MSKHLSRALARLAQTADKPDIVAFDVPMLTRIMELVLEDLKTDVELHVVLEKIISAASVKGAPLTMEDYGKIVPSVPKLEKANDQQFEDLKQKLVDMGVKYVNLPYRMFEIQRNDWRRVQGLLNKEGFVSISAKTMVKKGFPYNLNVTGQGNVYGMTIGRQPT